jgi:hypothetical protein
VISQKHTLVMCLFINLPTHMPLELSFVIPLTVILAGIIAVFFWAKSRPGPSGSVEAAIQSLDDILEDDAFCALSLLSSAAKELDAHTRLIISGCDDANEVKRLQVRLFLVRLCLV